MNLKEQIQNELYQEIYGMTLPEAIKQGVCVCCKKSAWMSALDDTAYEAYKENGLCPLCSAVEKGVKDA